MSARYLDQARPLDAPGLDAARHGLLGRREEQRRLAALLHGAREGEAGVLVLRGEAGIGKSARLSDVAKSADGFRVCRAGGVESEMELAYAGLQQLCGPLAGHNAELTTLHRNVLDQVFGLTEGPPPERFLVGIAALDLVATVAKKQPVVWLIDDAQWIDQASMQAIGFVARRLLAERVLILSLRATSATRTKWQGYRNSRSAAWTPRTHAGCLNRSSVAQRIRSSRIGSSLKHAAIPWRCLSCLVPGPRRNWLRASQNLPVFRSQA
jgi:hypothetical protein